MTKDQMTLGARVQVQGQTEVQTLERAGTKGGNSGFYTTSGLFLRDDQLERLTLAPGGAQGPGLPTDTRYRGNEPQGQPLPGDPGQPYPGGQYPGPTDPQDPGYSNDPRRLPRDSAYPGQPGGVPRNIADVGDPRATGTYDPALPRDPTARAPLADDLNVGRPADPLFVDDSRREARRQRQLTREQDRVGERQDIDDDERVRVEEALGRGAGGRGIRAAVAALSAEVTRLSTQVDRLTGTTGAGTAVPGPGGFSGNNPAYAGTAYPTAPSGGPYPAGSGAYPANQPQSGWPQGNPGSQYPNTGPYQGPYPSTPVNPVSQSGWPAGTAGVNMGRSVGGVSVDAARMKAVGDLRSQTAAQVKAGLVADGWSEPELSHILNG